MRKKYFSLFLAVIFTFAISYSLVHAYFASGYFGGKIYSSKAQEVQRAEDAGYDCEVYGSTVEVISLGKKSTRQGFFMGLSARNVTKNTAIEGKYILGKYQGEESITCTRDEEDGVTSQIEVLLPSVTLYGTSK